MAKKRVTIEQVRDKIKAMSGTTLADCQLVWWRSWGSFTYELVFHDEDVGGRPRFERIADVMAWLESFEKRNPAPIISGNQ